MNRVLRGVWQQPLRSVDRKAVGRNVSERRFSLEIERDRSSRPFSLKGEGGIPICVLASVMECFRGSNRRHAAKGFHVNKGEPSVSSGACRIKQANHARMIRRPDGSQIG
jgi:hypothetical protein